MLTMLEQNQNVIAALCRRYGVARLEVFGSAATGAFVPERSDLDFLVAFDLRSSVSLFDRYFGLLEELERLFGRKVDLVMESAMKNPYFIENVNRSRQPLYAA